MLLLPEKGKVYSPGEGVSVIGRDSGNEIQLLFESVSRRHAKLNVTAESCVLEDLGSANGTLVNGKKMSRQELRSGDEIKVGNCVLSFRICEEKSDGADHFVPRQYSDKTMYATVKMKKPPGFLKLPFLK